jgi:cytochrome c556
MRLNIERCKLFAPVRHFRRFERLAIALIVVGVGAGLGAFDLVATGQEQGAATAQDVILARKSLMNAIEDNTDRLTRMISDQAIDLPEARARANTIYVMLMALPHLFPPNSNQWKEDADLDPVTDTAASPDIWANFDDFYRLAAAAAQRADEMRRAADEEEVKRLHRALGNVCDFCHALYYKE